MKLRAINFYDCLRRYCENTGLFYDGVQGGTVKLRAINFYDCI